MMKTIGVSLFVGSLGLGGFVRAQSPALFGQTAAELLKQTPAPAPPAAEETTPRTEKERAPEKARIRVRGQKYVWAQGFVSRGSWVTGSFWINEMIHVSGDGASGWAHVSGYVTVTGHARRDGVAYVSGFANVSGSADLKDKDGRSLGSVRVTGSGYLSGLARNGWAQVSGNLDVSGDIQAP